MLVTFVWFVTFGTCWYYVEHTVTFGNVQTLVIKTKTSLRNYRIYKTKHYFISEERLFSTLFDLVCYYFDTGDGLTVRMTKPGLVAGPEGPRRIRESDITIGEQIGHGHFGEGTGNSRGKMSEIEKVIWLISLVKFIMEFWKIERGGENVLLRN